MEGKVFFSYQENGAAPDIRIHRKQVFFTYQQLSTITDTLNADTTRATAGAAGFNADTVRRPAVTVSAFADTSRIINAAGVLAADTSRILSGRYGLTADTRRLLAGVETFNADTIRTIATEIYADTLTADTLRIIHRTGTAAADTGRIISGIYSINSDTTRIISAADVLDADTIRTIKSTATFSDAFSADTIRRVVASNTVTADTIRNITAPDKTTADTGRIIHNNDTASADTLRNVHNTDSMAADTVRIFRNLDGLNADTSITIPYLMKALNPSEINISLEKGQLSETFEMTTPVDVALESAIKGKLLDFAYNFRAYSSSGRGLMRTITGMYDIDKLLYTPFTYTVPLYFNHTYTAKEHAKQVAHILGKNLKIDIDDFVPENNYAGMGATVQNIIGGLFGWMSNLPQRWINVFLRGDTLYIIQRGHEPHTIDISNTKHSRPMVDRKLMRSVWSGEGTRNVHSRKGIEPMPFDGTIRFGDAECTYRGGLLVHEVMQTSEGNVVTSYGYDYDDYLKSKTMTTKESTVTTTYEYAYTGNDRYLATETEVTTSNSDPTDTSTTVTQHVYIGNGWYGTSVFWDGSFQSSSVSSGKPGGKASKYVLDQSNLNLGSKYDDDEDSGSLIGAALFDTEFPVKDEDTLISLTKDIEWLNRKTEERISMDIWQYEHVIDFTDKVILNGHTYFLESNQVTKTPTECRQTVELVRWF